MRLWDSTAWKKHYLGKDCRHGMRLRFEPGIDKNMRLACIKYCNWARKYYPFPIRVVIYFKNKKYVNTKDNQPVAAVFSYPYDQYEEPYIRISMGDEILKDDAKREPLYIYECIAHELTHYYQWINGLMQSDKQMERQASYYAEEAVFQYLADVGLYDIYFPPEEPNGTQSHL